LDLALTDLACAGSEQCRQAKGEMVQYGGVHAIVVRVGVLIMLRALGGRCERRISSAPQHSAELNTNEYEQTCGSSFSRTFADTCFPTQSTYLFGQTKEIAENSGLVRVRR
jgi:hypothetical protein